MFQARCVIEATYYLLRVLAMLSCSVIISYSSVEADAYLLNRKLIATFKLNEKKNRLVLVLSTSGDLSLAS